MSREGEHGRQPMRAPSSATRKLLVLQGLGFLVVIGFLFADEFLDLPHLVFGAEATPINWRESLLEGLVAAGLGVFVGVTTWRLGEQVKRLEGILCICSFCKRIRTDAGWVPVESHVSAHSDAQFSHGLCPTCLEREYGKDLQATPKGESR